MGSSNHCLFDNYQSKISTVDAVVLNATLSHMYCVLGDFHVFTYTFVQNLLLIS